MMFILNNEPATHLVYSKHRLCVVLQDPSTATFNVTMFKTTDTEPGKSFQTELNIDFVIILGHVKFGAMLRIDA